MPLDFVYAKAGLSDETASKLRLFPTGPATTGRLVPKDTYVTDVEG